MSPTMYISSVRFQTLHQTNARIVVPRGRQSGPWMHQPHESEKTPRGSEGRDGPPVDRKQLQPPMPSSRVSRLSCIMQSAKGDIPPPNLRELAEVARLSITDEEVISCANLLFESRATSWCRRSSPIAGR
eukprot:6309799-Pyramimonas_sp.AAC.1